MLKRLFYKYGHLITAFAFTFVSVNANRICITLLHDPKKPEAMKKFRKF